MGLNPSELAPKAMAGGATVTPATIYGDFLTTNGLLSLSYGEWIQVLGAIYIAVLLSKSGYKIIKSLLGD